MLHLYLILLMLVAGQASDQPPTLDSLCVDTSFIVIDGDALAGDRLKEPWRRKLHMARPDLLPYPILVENYCALLQYHMPPEHHPGPGGSSTIYSRASLTPYASYS